MLGNTETFSCCEVNKPKIDLIKICCGRGEAGSYFFFLDSDKKLVGNH